MLKFTSLEDLKEKAIAQYEELEKEGPLYPSKENFLRILDWERQDFHSLIIGQDPYPNTNADGLAFSCNNFVSPSLRVILKSCGKIIINHSKPYPLDKLMDEGILLLNTSLTVPQDKAKQKGNPHETVWKPYTLALAEFFITFTHIETIYTWGNHAKKFCTMLMKREIENEESETGVMKLAELRDFNIIEDYHPSYYARRGQNMDKNKLKDIAEVFKHAN